INGALTLLVVVYLGRRLVSQTLERMVSIFGTVTGTATCGLLLLRIVDPEFKTTAVIELALMNLLVLPILFPCMMLVNAPLWWNWSLGVTLLAFAGIAILSFFLMKVFKVVDHPKF
ncbi:MAG: hypothetical protein KKC20_02895, partial [Proteobacteria bacterium]|nr:hypothetical protein [Pseudomonadota bacterium]